MAGFVYAPDAELDPAEIEEIERVSRDLWRAWHQADGDLMQRCVHPDLDARGLTRKVIDSRTELIAPDVLTRSELVVMTEAGVGATELEGASVDVTVLAATHHVASAKTVGNGQTNLFHLMRFPEGWRIVHAVWAFDGGVIPNSTTDI